MAYTKNHSPWKDFPDTSTPITAAKLDVMEVGIDEAHDAVDAHLADGSDAHDASAVSVVSTNLVGVGTNVQAVLEELDDAIAAGAAGESQELAYQSFTGEVPVTTDTVIVTAPAVDLDGEETVTVEFYCPLWGGNTSISLELFVAFNGFGSTSLGLIFDSAPGVGTFAAEGAIYVRIPLRGGDTPAAGSHVFSIRGSSPGDASVFGGVGGANTRIEGYVRVLAEGVAPESLGAASAVGFTPSGTIAATNVQDAIEEVAVEAGSGGLFDAYAYLREEQSANTNGGTFTQDAWQTRVLNTEVFDPDGIVSLSSNQFVLEAGTYFIKAQAPAHSADWHKLKVRNTTDSSDAIIGSNSRAQAVGDVGHDHAFLTGRITIAAQKTFELQHRCLTTKASNGLGIACNFGVVEVYSEVEIWREA